MNGRCETDPLDRAVDVCDSCYGEFCKACLVLPKGRRHPICTHCTLALSGVRGHATVQQRGDKRTAKQRRSELQAAAAEPADDKVFRFFDADTEPVGSEAEGSGRKAGRRTNRRDRRGRPAPGGQNPGPKPGTAPLPMPAEVAAAAAALKAAATGGTDEGQAGAAGVDHGPGAEPADPTELVTVTRAVARLEELRRQGTPPVGSPVPPVPERAGGDVARSDAEGPAAADTGDGPIPGDGTDGPADAEKTAAGRMVAAEEAAAATGSEATPRKAGPPPKPKVAAAPRPDRRRPEGADREGRPPTAPMVGEVRTIGGRRGSDQAPPPQPARPRPAAAAGSSKAVAATVTQERRPAPGEAGLEDDDLVDVGEALSGVERFDARQPPPAPAGAGEGRKADTDSQGNWIPPILRGMAPDAREAKTNLPRRKRGS